MKAKVKQEFIGIINDIEIKSENNYYAILYLISELEEKFKITFEEKFTDEFIKDLNNVLETIYYKYDNVSISEIEIEFKESIDRSESIEALQFELYGNDWKFKWFNECLSSGEYLKQEN